MDFIGSVFTKIVEDGIFSETSLLLIIICLLAIGYQYVLKPLMTKVENIPTKKDLDDSKEYFDKNDEDIITDIKRMIDSIEKDDARNFNDIKNLLLGAENNIQRQFDDVRNMVDRMTMMLDSIEFLEQGTAKDLQTMQTDIENIKQILNQFQGHMLFGHSVEPKTSRNFGNRELK